MRPADRAFAPMLLLAAVASFPAAARDDFGAACRDRPPCTDGTAGDEATRAADLAVVRAFVTEGLAIGLVDGVPGAGHRITMAEMHLFCVRNGMIVETCVRGMNPLMWQMIYRDTIAASVLPTVAK